MNRYEIMMEGKIITINNFTFDDGKLDHAWNTGRLCLILYTDDENEYVLPITHSINKKFKHQYVYINEESFEEINKNRCVQSTLKNKTRIIHKEIKGYINLSSVYPIPIAYRNELGKLKYECYKNVLTKINEYHKTKTLEQTIERAVAK